MAGDEDLLEEQAREQARRHSELLETANVVQAETLVAGRKLEHHLGTLVRSFHAAEPGEARLKRMRLVNDFLEMYIKHCRRIAGMSNSLLEAAEQQEDKS